MALQSARLNRGGERDLSNACGCNGWYVASGAMRLCGGGNIFAALAVKAPLVGIGPVLQADPEVVGSAAPGTEPPSCV